MDTALNAPSGVPSSSSALLTTDLRGLRNKSAFSGELRELLLRSRLLSILGAVLAAVWLQLPHANGAEIVAHVPESAAHDEAALWAAAQAVEPEISESGHRVYDLVVARVATWKEPKELVLRLMLPAGAEAGDLPLVAYVHGGGFIGGSPSVNIDSDRGFSEAFRALLDDGFAVASLPYRLAREAGWPAPISDPLSGLRFLRQYGDHWGLDAQRVALIGHSAGARVVALMGMVPQNEFHRQDLPWQSNPEPVSIAGVWLWAGSPLTYPLLSEWHEFGKPRNFSVPRLHHGEHPAWTEGTRQSLRIRNSAPHLSNALPPYYFLRGSGDYGGDHSDVEAAVELWQALGSTATLSIVDGGHNVSGPATAVVAFMDEVLRGEQAPRPDRDAQASAQALLAHGDAVAAIEVLNAAHTTADGSELGAGEWLFLSDQRMLWLPHTQAWPQAHQSLVETAFAHLASAEMDAAQDLVERGQWFRARQAAANVRHLQAGESGEAANVLSAIEAQVSHEEQVFKTLAAANQAVHADGMEAARTRLQQLEDPRLASAAKRLGADPGIAIPDWATASGQDVYGPWVRVAIDDATAVRLRWVAPGSWQLPEHLHYRNKESQPWSTEISIEHGFWISEVPTTLGQWRALNRDDGHGLDDDRAEHPRGRIEYLQIVDWLERLSARHPELLARLPTEEEWLHAMTAGGRSDSFGSLDQHAIHALAVDPEQPTHLSVYGQLPDLSGLYAGIGGVMEWTASPGSNEARFSDDKGNFRIIAYPIARGGAWSSMPQVLGLDSRHQQRHGNRQPDLGFRLVIGGGPDAAQWRKGVEKR